MTRGLVAAVCITAVSVTLLAQGQPLPQLTEPVNDFADVIDAADERVVGDLSRRLQAASGDVVVVVTVPTYEPYGDIREYAVKVFENGGRGIGDRGQDNGLLILLAVKERRVWIEVGYGLEQWITDGFAGETARDRMAPSFRAGNYGEGLVAGTTQIVGRIAQGRNVALEGVPSPRPRASRPGFSVPMIVLVFVLIVLVSRSMGGPGRRFRSRRGVWSSGVGPFGVGWTIGRYGGGFGGGPRIGGGGFGGGFRGFGGRSGGGGGGAGW